MDEEFYNSTDVLNIFEIILKNYLDLMDTNQFIDILIRHYAYQNNMVFGTFFQLIVHEESLNTIRQMSFKIRQQRFYRLLDQISSSKRIISFLKNELFISFSHDQLTQIVTNFCGSVLIMVLRILNNLNVKLLDIELRKYQNTLFIPFLTFIDEHFTANQCSQNDVLIKEILEFLSMTSDQTLTIPIVINANYPQACLRWLSLSYLNAHEYAYTLRIVYNIARHDEGIIILNRYKCYDVLMQFNTTILNKHVDLIIDKKWFEDLQLTYFMITILIGDSKELATESIKWFIKHRLTPVILSSIRLRASRHQNFHMSELMIVLMRLCTNDDYIHCILQKHYLSLPQYMSDILNFLLYCVEIERFDYNTLASDVLTVTALANILWSISFHDQYKNNLRENIQIINRLEKFESSNIIDKSLPYIYKSCHISSLRRAIDGILQNLFPLSFLNVEIPSSTKTKSVCSVMISYSQFNMDFCRQLYGVLSTFLELSISVDFNNSKYSWKDIVQTIVQSDLILFLISKNFFNSKSCRQQLIYVTDTLKKPFIPVFINGDYRVSGWLEKRIHTSKSIRFDEKNFVDTCNDLLSIVKECLSVNITPVKHPFDIKQWNEDEVKQWFSNNHLIPELHEFYRFQNGNELLLYAQATLTFPWTKEYERIKLRFEEKFQIEKQYLSPHEFLKFINALNRLQSKNLTSL